MKRLPPKNGPVEKIKISTLVVDGNALYKRGFSAAKNEYNHHGEHIGGVYPFLTALRKILEENLYHKVYVFWDGNFSGKLRYDIYKPYKSGRGKDYENGTQPIDESELAQRARVYEYLNELYVRQLRHDIVESDDFIAYYCLNKKENEKITICTNDSDMAQLIDENVRIYYLNFKQYVDNTNFSSYFCYNRENAALVKAMTGDTADTIKGIKGLGEKTLVTLFPELIERKVSLTEILEKAKQLQEERKSKKQKPLVSIDNIINRVTDGIQGDEIYEINYALVNLKQPMITEDAIEELNNLIEGTLHEPKRDIQKVFKYINEDGLRNTIGESRYEDYLAPFKQLKNREDLNF
jgi:5'-3' exonuclease